MAWVGTVGLRGANGKVSNVTYNIPAVGALPADQYASAKSTLDSIVTELANVTQATIAYKRVSNTYDEDSAAGAGDVFEKATISVHIGATGAAEKFATINIPAPADGIFLAATGSGRDVVDVGDADLQAYVQELTNVTISDGEVINDALGTSGMDSGRRTLARVKLT